MPTYGLVTRVNGASLLFQVRYCYLARSDQCVLNTQPAREFLTFALRTCADVSAAKSPSECPTARNESN